MSVSRAIFSLFLILILTVSCTIDEACRQERNAPVNVALFRVIFNQTTEQYVNQPYNVPLQVTPIGSDSILYNGSVSTLALPLKRIVGETLFQLNDTLTGLTDTLTFIYSVEDDFVSLECGCVPTFFLQSVETTNYNIDSAVIVEPSVDTYEVNNVNLYFLNNTSN